MTRFVDNKDGTVTDTKTGLMWQAETVVPMHWQEAMNYATNLNLAGHTDWSLPTITELFSLIDHSIVEPATKFPRTNFANYWSSTTYANIPDYAWFVYVYLGEVSYADKSRCYQVRVVRG